MVSSRVHAGETELQHVQEPGQWMPVPHGAVCERPLEIAPSESLDVYITGNVVRIVQQQELVARDGAEAQEGEREEQRRYKKVLIPRRTKQYRALIPCGGHRRGFLPRHI